MWNDLTCTCRFANRLTILYQNFWFIFTQKVFLTGPIHNIYLLRFLLTAACFLVFWYVGYLKLGSGFRRSSSSSCCATGNPSNVFWESRFSLTELSSFGLYGLSSMADLPVALLETGLLAGSASPFNIFCFWSRRKFIMTSSIAFNGCSCSCKVLRNTEISRSDCM